MLGLGSAVVSAADWPRFRGRDFQGTSSESFLTSWPPDGPSVRWTVPGPEIGSGGYGSLVVAQGRVFTLLNDLDGERWQEYCLALDEATGRRLWATLVDDAEGANSTTTVVDGRVYVYSGRCKLHCLDAANGKVLWKRDLVREFRAGEVDWGNSQSPWVGDGRVFASIIAPTNCLMAFDASDGALLWQGHTNALTYASPVGGSIQGVRQIIFPDRYGLVAVTPDSGRLLWRHRQGHASQQGPSPVVHGNVILSVKSNDGTGTQAVRIDSSNGVFSAHGLWTMRQLGDLYTTMVVHGDHVYATSMMGGGRLRCLELAAGKVRWESSAARFSSAILVGQHLVALADNGCLLLIEASPIGYREVARSPARPKGDRAMYLNSPAFANGRLYLRDSYEVVCLGAAPPPLRMDVSLPAGTDRAQFTVSCCDGSALAANRAAQIGLRWSSDLRQPPAQWTRMTLPLAAPPVCSRWRCRLCRKGHPASTGRWSKQPAVEFAPGHRWQTVQGLLGSVR